MEKQVKFAKKRTKKLCYFTTNKFEVIDYKNVKLLSKFVTDRGKIVPKRSSGLQAKWQRKLAQAIKRARYMGLLPYCVDN